MSLDRCIPGLVDEGKLTKEQGDRALEIYGRRKAAHSGSLGDETAAALASEEAVAALEREAAIAKMRKLLQLQVQKDILVKTAGYDGGSGKNPGRATEALFVRDERATYPNFEYRRRFHIAEAHAQMEAILSRFSRNAIGQLRNKAQLVNLEAEAFGEHTGDEAAHEMAKAWEDTADTLRRKRNAAGGATGKLEHWGLPQYHDSVTIADVGFDAWYAAEAPRLDRARMIDDESGLPFDDAGFDAAMRSVFENIATDGWAKRTPGGVVGKGMLAGQRAEHRFLIYKSAADWRASQDQFGDSSSAFDIMMRHIETISNEVALMQILGPNPAATVGWLKDGLEKGAALDGTRVARDAAHKASVRLDRAYAEISGANARPESRAIALGFSALRAWQTSTKLGSAPLSAISDIANQTVTRLYNGLPVTTMAAGYLKSLKPSLAADRAQAMRFGLTADDAAQSLRGESRFGGLELTGEIAKRAAEMTMRLSGLNRVTRVGRWSFGMDAIATLTNESVKPFDAIEGPFRGMLQRYGIDEAGWDGIRSTALELDRGAPWLKPLSIEDAHLRSRVVEMILAETDMAVPTPGLEARALVGAFAPRGNIGGELARSAFQFKGFGVSLLVNNWRRMMTMSSLPPKLIYSFGLTGMLSLLGVMTIELRELSKGRDPRSLKDKALWMQGTLQGGALGIYGDFLTNAQNRFGGGVADTLAGPMWGTANQVGKLAFGDPLLAAQGQPTNAGREAVKLLQGETPVAGSLWYTRAAYQHLLQSQLQEWIDPNYGVAWQRMREDAQRRTGQGYWYDPGHLTPSRAPDMDNLFADPPQRAPH